MFFFNKSLIVVIFSCLAGGYPTPTYAWYREEYMNDKLVSRLIKPLTDRRFTISGGTLIINDPKQVIFLFYTSYL